jgi:hypothetical protein
MPHADDFSHSFGLCVEFGMAQQATNENGGLCLFHCKVDQTISVMAKRSFIEIRIAREEGGATLLKKERDDLGILHTRLTDVETDLPNMDAPAFKKQSLIFGDILIQQIHAAGLMINSSACVSSALLASCTASRMASFVMLSFQSSMMVSHAIPLAT